MSMHLQQPDLAAKKAGRKAAVSLRSALLNADTSLFLVLLLGIIPSISGVALIA